MKQNSQNLNQKNGFPWQAFLLGILSFIVSVLGNQLLQPHLSWSGIVILITLTLGGVLIGVCINHWPKKRWLWIIAVVYIICIALFIILYANFRCPNQSYTHASTLINLIHAESQAVKEKNIKKIEKIFDKNAIIHDKTKQRIWKDPIARYQALFSNATFLEASHYEIDIFSITGSSGNGTSGSRGVYYRNTDKSVKISYKNPPGTDEWQFGLNSSGCWVVTRFSFR